MFRTMTAKATALAVLLLPAIAAAQEPVRSFDQLDTRLKVGDRVWVTDAKGVAREGKILELSASSLRLDADPAHELLAPDIQVVEERPRDSLKNGALIGLGTGAAIGTALIVSVCAQEGCTSGDAGFVAAAVAIYAGLGAAIGTGIDALKPGKKRTVYRASGGSSSARVTVGPLVTPRVKILAVSFSF